MLKSLGIFYVVFVIGMRIVIWFSAFLQDGFVWNCDGLRLWRLSEGKIHAALTVNEFRCRVFLLSETILWCRVTSPGVRKERQMLWDWSCSVPYRNMRTIHGRCWSFRLNGEREGSIIHPIYMYIKEKEDAYAGLQTEDWKPKWCIREWVK